MINVTTEGIDELVSIFNRREHMVEDMVSEGERRAESYAEAGGRHRKTPGRYTYLRRSVVRVRHATGAQMARMVEHVAYHRFIDFFGSW